MIIGSMWGKFVMSLFREYILEVLAPVWKDSFLDLCSLSDLGRDGDFSNSFPSKPSFSFLESADGFQICIHFQPSQQISLWDGRFCFRGEALT